ncbi:MAG: SAM-dependent methyltransferase [Bacteroidales bacterium]|jgi:16S rRNA (cytidine1402-2'-O)-methyltransferase|nr:SAM-dependent methyltransferase [Bacteroidales bacterium]
MSDNKGKLYLLPTPIGDNDIFASIPVYNKTIIDTIRVFVVEEIRTARRFLRKLNPDFPIDDCRFYILNEHTLSSIDLSSILRLAIEGESIGVLSEAGLPCVADPGSDLVLLAQQKDITVVPLVGPSSITMTLMASGLCGQQFAFHGYLPANKSELIDKVHKLEQSSRLQRQTQLFIETPYRNNQVFDALLTVCKANTLLCIACNINQNEEYIKTKTIMQWKQCPQPQLHKKPTVFALLAEK